MGCLVEPFTRSSNHSDVMHRAFSWLSFSFHPISKAHQTRFFLTGTGTDQVGSNSSSIHLAATRTSAIAIEMEASTTKYSQTEACSNLCTSVKIIRWELEAANNLRSFAPAGKCSRVRKRFTTIPSSASICNKRASLRSRKVSILW